MTKQNIMAIVALITIGMTGAVYAETATVEIPFDSHGSTCTFDELSVEFQCVWQGFKEVYTLEDLENYKTEVAIRQNGKLRVEGKNYVVQDGDICHFLFNV